LEFIAVRIVLEGDAAVGKGNGSGKVMVLGRLRWKRKIPTLGESGFFR